jgi:hypothetical protein
MTRPTVILLRVNNPAAYLTSASLPHCLCQSTWPIFLGLYQTESAVITNTHDSKQQKDGVHISLQKPLNQTQLPFILLEVRHQQKQHCSHQRQGGQPADSTWSRDLHP